MRERWRNEINTQAKTKQGGEEEEQEWTDARDEWWNGTQRKVKLRAPICHPGIIILGNHNGDADFQFGVKKKKQTKKIC